MHDVVAKVTRIVADWSGAPTSHIRPENTFDDLGVDSLDLIEIVMDVEDEFDIRVDEIDEINTFQDLINAIMPLVAARAAA